VHPLIRPFEDRDYVRWAQIAAANDPHWPHTLETLRHHDGFVEPRVRVLRLVAEVDAAGVVGFGRVMHIWWAYHPRRYHLRVEVDPDWQRQGVGSALFDRLMGELNTWDPELVRGDTRGHAVEFLEHRGFTEWRRRWDSTLDVASANLLPLLAADRRIPAQGITISTYPAELARRGDRLAYEVYQTELLTDLDEPGTDRAAEGMSFQRFAATELDAPDSLPEAHFLALDGERLVGLSRLLLDPNHPDTLRQAFTGTHPEYRGRGIAQVLKLRTIQFARAHGYRQIRTANDSSNAPMLHINTKIGFKRESLVVVLERPLDETNSR
jgi:GNAT superfamily N-acetyltransferase